MLTMVYRVVVKAGCEELFQDVALKCTECAHESADCLYYTFYASLANPREFLVYYRFTDKAAQDRHIEHLQHKIGPASGKGELPDAFLDLIEEEEIVFFQPA